MRHKLFGVVLVSLGLMSAGSLSLWAGQHEGHGGGGGMSMPMPTQEFIKTGKYTGKVLSVDRGSITIEVRKKGQAETITFLTNDQTKTKGDIIVGAEVKVKYREEKAQKVATSIEAMKAKTT